MYGQISIEIVLKDYFNISNIMTSQESTQEFEDINSSQEEPENVENSSLGNLDIPQIILPEGQRKKKTSDQDLFPFFEVDFNHEHYQPSIPIPPPPPPSEE